jgi:hypothetical protein
MMIAGKGCQGIVDNIQVDFRVLFDNGNSCWFAEEEAKLFDLIPDEPITQRSSQLETNATMQTKSELDFFRSCSSDCCQKCSAPLPCKYHS